MEKYMLIHEHKFGTSTAIFAVEEFSAKKEGGFSQDELVKIAAKCSLDYEDDNEESLDAISLDTDVTIITEEDLK